jgi:hypothetical protein
MIELKIRFFNSGYPVTNAHYANDSFYSQKKSQHLPHFAGLEYLHF